MTSRKVKAFYVCAALLCLAFIAPVVVPTALPAFVAFASAMTTLCGLFFGSNVWQKKVTQPVFLRQLELNGNGQPEDEDLIGEP